MKVFFLLRTLQPWLALHRRGFVAAARQSSGAQRRENHVAQTICGKVRIVVLAQSRIDDVDACDMRVPPLEKTAQKR
jgi:hypothetical protein